MERWILKTFTTYRGNFYRPGEVMELSEEDVESYPLKALVERGHLVRAECGKESEQLRTDLLEEINGIGPTYAEEIVERYVTVDELLEAGVDRISDEVSGVDLEKAQEIIQKLS